MTERVHRDVCQRAASRLVPRFGSPRDPEAWVPINADRIFPYLTTGA